MCSKIVLLVLLSMALGACKRDAPQVEPPHAAWIAQFEPWPGCLDGSPSQQWFRLRIQGQDAGAEHRQERVCMTGQGERRLIEARAEFAFLRSGERIEVAASTRHMQDASGRLLRLEHREGQAGHEQQRILAGRVGDELVTVRGPELHRVPFEPQALDDLRFARHLLFSDPPAPGQILRFRAYSRRTAGYVDHKIEILTVGADRALSFEHRSRDVPGQAILVQLDAGREPISERAELGLISMEAQRLAGPPTNWLPEVLPDISVHMRLATEGRISKPDDLIRARYRLVGLPDYIRIEDMQGPGQRATAADNGAGVIVEVARIEPPKGRAAPGSGADPRFARWLAPTALAQADHPSIRALAAEQSSGAQTDWEAALALRDWVEREVRGDLGMTFGSALQTLRTRKGDCSEQAVLLTALARARGIPARAIAGLVYTEEAFGGHMWTEVWAGAWIPLDAALGPQQVSAARIRLGVDPLELGQQDADASALMSIMVSGTRVIIEQLDHGPPVPP